MQIDSISEESYADRTRFNHNVTMVICIFDSLHMTVPPSRIGPGSFVAAHMLGAAL